MGEPEGKIGDEALAFPRIAHHREWDMFAGLTARVSDNPKEWPSHIFDKLQVALEALERNEAAHGTPVKLKIGAVRCGHDVDRGWFIHAWIVEHQRQWISGPVSKAMQ